MHCCLLTVKCILHSVGPGEDSLCASYLLFFDCCLSDPTATRDFLLDGTHLYLTVSPSHTLSGYRKLSIWGLRSHMTELDLTDSEVEKRNPSVMTDDEVMSR